MRAVLSATLGGLTEGNAVFAEPGSYAVSIVGSEGRALWRDADFTALAAGAIDAGEVRRLVAAARQQGYAVGVLTIEDAAPLSAIVRTGHLAEHWPLPADARQVLAAHQGAAVLAAIAPSRSPALALTASQALGLSPREAELAAALLEAPNLAAAADRTGMSRETAKDTLARACRRLGVRDTSELVARLLQPVPDQPWTLDPAILRNTGLTPAEVRVTQGVARGESIAVTARTIGVTEATIKSHRAAILSKTGAASARDLRRLLIEGDQAARLASAAEIVHDPHATGERLRITTAPDGRRIAWIDYGPASGRPLFVLHYHGAWRRLPAPFAARLCRTGWRPIVPQRPGFGLSEPARGDYLATAAADMATILDRVGAKQATLLAPGPAVPAALAFTANYPMRLKSGVLVNPQPTREHAPQRGGPLFALTRLLMRRPRLIAFVAKRAVSRTKTPNMRALVMRLYQGLEDRLPPERPDITDHLVQDMQALHARGVHGIVEELRLFASGWTPPATIAAGPWRVAISPRSWARPGADAYAALPGYEPRKIDGVVALRAYTAPDAIIALLDQA